MSDGFTRAGGVDARSPIWLAPLAGVTTGVVRDFHAALGAGLVHTEMISSIGLARGNAKTLRMTGDREEKCPAVIQLFGPDADWMRKGAETALAARKFDALEVNMACPMPKVTKKCGGAALLYNPAEAGRIVKKLKPLGLPLWVKLRITDTSSHPLSTEDFCEVLAESGADLLLLHGRYPSQRYEGTADKAAVCAAAGKFPGMVAGSGDFYSPQDARIYLEGGCTAVLAARGILRDVFLIPKTLAHLGLPFPRKFLDPPAETQAEILAEAGRDALRREGERRALVMVRRMSAGMFKGFPGVSSLRSELASFGDWDSAETCLLRIASSRPVVK
ncbi:MAG: tRNA-dihydrouridine synthase [Synergistaceae bacterium]|jgi:tRNA-dihydrouridine synthase B|nr:tRNA-dihydrouridine synthase [Synergistaceae bacterium]